MQMFGPLGSQRYLGYAGDILTSGRLLLSVIDDILDLSKIEAGRLELHEDTVDLAKTVSAAVRLVHTRANEGELRLLTRLPHPVPALWADQRQVMQMLVNLLTNAVKFTPRGGEITVGGRRTPDGGLILTVSDTGIGIAPGDLPRVLTPFLQVDNHLTRTQAGTGLGVPLVKALIELHGGRFRIESQPGAGTSVELLFPSWRVLGTGGISEPQGEDPIPGFL